MNHKYRYSLGLLARVLLWSNGELGSSVELELEMQQHVKLLRAKLRAIEAQLQETAGARRSAESRRVAKEAEERDGLEEATERQSKLPWEA